MIEAWILSDLGSRSSYSRIADPPHPAIIRKYDQPSGIHILLPLRVGHTTITAVAAVNHAATSSAAPEIETSPPIHQSTIRAVVRSVSRGIAALE
jgi:hypothetical protein